MRCVWMTWCSGAAEEKMKRKHGNKEKLLTNQKCPSDSHHISETQHTSKRNARTSIQDTTLSSASTQESSEPKHCFLFSADLTSVLQKSILFY